MSTKKVKNSVGKERLLALHNLGLLPDISARKKKLTESENKRIRKYYLNLHSELEIPNDFTALSVKGMTPAKKKILTDSGIKIIENRALIPKQGYSSVKFKTESIKEKGKYGKTQILTIARSQADKDGGRKSEVEYMGTALQKMAWRDRLMFQYRNKELKDGEFIALKVFDRGIMQASIMDDIGQLMNYGANIRWHDKGKNIPELENNLHLVKIRIKRGADLNNPFKALESNVLSQKQINQRKYQRKKSRKKIGGRLIGKIKKG